MAPGVYAAVQVWAQAVECAGTVWLAEVAKILFHSQTITQKGESSDGGAYRRRR
jgi:hypothetical protein